MTEACPSCLNECKDDVTIEDHGVCWDCHHEMLNGERCRDCYEYGHDRDDCPEREEWTEYYRSPFTGRWYRVDNHPSLTDWERNA